MVIQVRPVRGDDAAQIAGLLGQLGHPTDAAAVTQRLAGWFDDASTVLLGATDDALDPLLGVLALQTGPLLEAAGRFARVLVLVVDERHQGRGVGRALLDAAERLARDAGCVVMEASTSRRRDGALRFYRDRGYDDTCGTRARFTKPLVDR
jgi:GNAT superfamily N-acetyltransferase